MAGCASLVNSVDERPNSDEDEDEGEDEDDDDGGGANANGNDGLRFSASIRVIESCMNRGLLCEKTSIG